MTILLAKHRARRGAGIVAPTTRAAARFTVRSRCLTAVFSAVVSSNLLVAPTRAQNTVPTSNALAAPIPAATRNLLVGARISGNLGTFAKGERGLPEQIIFDTQKNVFAAPSEWHEYGVGFGEDLGVVPEDKAAFWMAEWDQPVQANLIALSGAYPNQPQPDAAWKIEVRNAGVWSTHARGVGGWYDRGLYRWNGAAPLRFDALRVSVFSKDGQTPVRSVHFRGEAGKSWLAARLPPFAARVAPSLQPLRAGQRVQLSAQVLAGTIRSWKWSFADGSTAMGQTVRHRFDKAGEQAVTLEVSDGKETSAFRETLQVLGAVHVDLEPLKAAVVAGQGATFVAKTMAGKPGRFIWDFGDGTRAVGKQVTHRFARPGVYQVRLTASDGRYEDDCLAIVRAHSPATVGLPQIVLDTDAKNEEDDQHYLGYALWSELDLLAVNSIHNGGGQEARNLGEIQHVFRLAREAALPQHRFPPIFRGADVRLTVPESGLWSDTKPIVTPASEAILAAVRGAAPGNPVWIVPVGPATNMASALLQARRENVPLQGRMRIVWMGGSNDSLNREFNGDNDPWSAFVMARSGIDTQIVNGPVGARVSINKNTEGDLYADNPLGRYLKEITPGGNKPLFDPACLSVIISEKMGLGWVKESDFVTVAGPEQSYRWTKSDTPTTVRVIRQIDQKAMQLDIFNSMKGSPTKLTPKLSAATR